MKPNEFGDLLAGAFSPLAFAWFVYAVFMQRDELELQRNELTETRKVLAQQQKSQQESADSSKELANQMLEQNLLSRRQLLIDQYRFFSDKYNSICSQIVSLKLSYGKYKETIDIESKNISREVNIYEQRDIYLFHNGRSVTPKKISDDILSILRNIPEFDAGILESDDVRKLIKILDILILMKDITEIEFPELRVAFDNEGFLDLTRTLQKLKTMVLKETRS